METACHNTKHRPVFFGTTDVGILSTKQFFQHRQGCCLEFVLNCQKSCYKATWYPTDSNKYGGLALPLELQVRHIAFEFEIWTTTCLVSFKRYFESIIHTLADEDLFRWTISSVINSLQAGFHFLVGLPYVCLELVFGVVNLSTVGDVTKPPLTLLI